MGSIEKKYRTITRLVIWQTIAICITTIILIIAINNLDKALTYGIIDHVICLVFHYFYDRLWLKISWGLDLEEEVKPSNLIESKI